MSSVNVLRVGKEAEKLDEHVGEEGAEEVLEEGGDGDGEEWRESRGVPETAAARMRHFLQLGKTEEWSGRRGGFIRAIFSIRIWISIVRLRCCLYSRTPQRHLLTLWIYRLLPKAAWFLALSATLFRRRGFSAVRGCSFIDIEPNTDRIVIGM